MKKKAAAMSLAMILLLSGCAVNANQETLTESSQENVSTIETVTEQAETTEAGTTENETTEAATTEAESTETEPTVETSNILVVYFSRLENTDADLDTIVQGGGPYGEIGTTYEGAELDAISTASITVRNGEAQGNTRAVAEMIQELTGGDLFSIHTVESYPVDYDELIDQGGEEHNTGARPELVEQVENMENYDIVFLGFPNWWLDMPMAMYTFLESYDFTGKTIIPFATSAGSGLSNAAGSIRETCPGAEVSSDGLHIPMREAAEAYDTVAEWLTEIGMTTTEE